MTIEVGDMVGEHVVLEEVVVLVVVGGSSPPPPGGGGGRKCEITAMTVATVQY